MGVNELLKSKEYYIAAMDEIAIEQGVQPRDQDGQLAASVDLEQEAMRAALQVIDLLKISGDYERERARLWDDLGLARYRSGGGVKLPAALLDFAKEWGNLKNGMESPDRSEREQFRKFFEVAQLGPKSPPEIHPLISVLRRVKKRRGRTPKLKPAWLKDTDELDKMRLLHAKGMSIPEAARQVAQDEGFSQQDSRAKRFENLFRNRMKLR
ncbi:hypothetical protein C1J03_06950 [Sulfitobacter sp. SK012]|uniref:hypothetical protein n=1 Tax=Sulfitobacter sp. SK012 TaxID=1389005 RepID=UPI000E0B0DCF|nr:hypothetical protein [Sulfitobacter sp. SK012]AXI45791.1 hypothetical protein C1J03_06950 [Sulfitobacter sp. SK012]